MSSNAPSRIEQRSIDYVPPDERHGKPWNLFTFWFATNMNLVPVAIGATTVFLGVNIGWAIVGLVIGNVAGGFFMAYHSVQGPRLGIPQMIQSRAQFGFYGAIIPLVIVEVMYIGFFTTSGILGGQALAPLLHIPTVLAIILFNLVSLLITWAGHDLFHQFDKVMSIVSGLAFIALLVRVIQVFPAHLHIAGATDSFGAIILVISVAVSGQITWAPYVSDYSRYLPENTSSRKTFLYTYFGSVIGSTWMTILGALAGFAASSAVSANLPKYLSQLLNPVSDLILLVLAFGMLSASFPNLYGSFLTAISTFAETGKGAPGWLQRLVATLCVAVIGTLLGILGSASLIAAFTNFLLLILYALIPWTAINLTDYYFLRRGKYDVTQFFKRNGEYGYVQWTTVAIYVVSILVEVPFISSPLYTGPIAKAMGGGDISWIIGMVVAGALYYFVERARRGRASRSGLSQDATVGS